MPSLFRRSRERKQRRETNTALFNMDSLTTIERLPCEAIEHVINYLPAPSASVALLAAALRVDGQGMAPAWISSAFSVDGNDELDFGDIEPDLAERLTDDDLAAMLECIRAKTTIRTLKLQGLVNITGCGLKSLSGSSMIQQIDLDVAKPPRSRGVKKRRKSQKKRTSSISRDEVIPIVDSILEADNNSLRICYSCLDGDEGTLKRMCSQCDIEYCQKNRCSGNFKQCRGYLYHCEQWICMGCVEGWKKCDECSHVFCTACSKNDEDDVECGALQKCERCQSRFYCEECSEMCQYCCDQFCTECRDEMDRCDGCHNNDDHQDISYDACDKCLAKCETDDCPNMFCPGCSKYRETRHRNYGPFNLDRCDDCKKNVCNMERRSHEGCVSRCFNCSSKICADCSSMATCDQCFLSMCDKCCATDEGSFKLDQCDNCGRNMCNIRRWCVSKCDVCSTELCWGCQELERCDDCYGHVCVSCIRCTTERERYGTGGNREVEYCKNCFPDYCVEC